MTLGTRGRQRSQVVLSVLSKHLLGSLGPRCLHLSQATPCPSKQGENLSV